MKYKLFALFTIIAIITSCAGSKVTRTAGDDSIEEIQEFLYAPDSRLPVLEFKEIWGYVVAGREAALVPNLPLTDVAYFGAEVNMYGKITDVPRRQALPSHFKGRVHFVIACSSRSLSYFTLREGSQERKEYIDDIVRIMRDYDGLNVDLELVPARSADAFASFLVELRQRLPGKILSLCVPARTRKLENDVYDYEKLTPLVDRVFVMAYDEHWSGSRPGSVASIAWCRNVAQHSLRTIGPEKLIMGLPFYGRAWGNYSPSRALVHSSIDNIIKEHHIRDIKYENGVPTFNYNKNVNIRVYFEDEYSLVSRMNMYKNMGVDSVGFWRIGQETKEIWQYLKIATASSITNGNTARPSQTPIFTPTAVTNIALTTPSQTASAPVRYTVRSGDSLWTISRRYGITMQALAAANNMNVNDTLRIGRVLTIPAR